MKKIVVMLAIAAAAAAIVFGIGRRSRCGAQSASTLDQMGDAQRLTRALGLSGAQAAEVSGLEKQYVRTQESCCAAHCEARMKLGQIMFQTDTSEEQLRAAVEKMCKAQMESDMATLRHIREVHGVLTSEQQKRYQEMVAGCVCAACPNKFDHAHPAAP